MNQCLIVVVDNREYSTNDFSAHFVSSANRYSLETTFSGKLFMNERNATGPITVLCGTLLITLVADEIQFWYFTT